MRAYAGVWSQSATTDPGAFASSIQSIAERALPIRSLVPRSFVAAGGRSVLAFWSNEDLDASDSAWWQAATGALAVAGHLDDVDAVGKAGASGDLDRLERTLERSAGVYSACAAAAGSGELRAWNTLVRVESVYWQEAPERIAVSNRPLLAHLLATGAGSPRYVVANLVPFLNTGYYGSEETPFDGLHVLPQHSELRIGPAGLTVARRTVFEPELSDDLEAILVALARSCEPVRRTGRPITVNLTGGRDSRLLAATLRAAQLDFETVTKGAPDHPDVALARQVAGALGVEHRTSWVAKGRSSAWVTVDVPTRVATSLRTTDGLLSGYDNVPTPGSRFDPRVVLNGVGGELFRGGYAKQASPRELNSPDAFVQRIWLGARPFIRADVAKAYQAYVEELGKAGPEESGAEVLDRLYLRYRTGRWIAATRMANAGAYHYFQPLLDSAIIDAVRRVPLVRRVDERLMFELMQRLSPALAELPVVGSRWSFEEPRSGAAADSAWRSPGSVVVNLTAGNVLDWRRTRGAALDQVFRERLLDSRQSPVFDLVDRSALERLLAPRRELAVGIRRFAEAQFLWAAYASDVLLSNDWLRPRVDGRSSQIRVRPGTLDRLVFWALPLVRRARDRAKAAWRTMR